MEKPTLEGILHFHSETGTEGGHWAFQDERFISCVPPRYGVWDNQVVWDSTNPERKGKTQKDVEVFRKGQWYPLNDPMHEDPDFFASSLFRGEGRGDHEADKRLMKRYDFTIKYAADWMNERYGEGNWHLEDSSTVIVFDGTRIVYGGTPSTEPQRPYGVGANDLTRVMVEWEDRAVEQRLSNSILVSSWSYEGLHILGNRDHLTIYDSQKKDQLLWSGVIALQQYDLFTQAASGMWIHADQKGIEREVWAKYFFDKCPATLVPYRSKK